MGSSKNFPLDRDGSSTTASVADLIDGLPLPTADLVNGALDSLSGLPPLPVPGEAGSWSSLDAVQVLMDDCLATAGALRRHQNRCAALLAVSVEQLETVTAVEGGLLNLDPWQRGMLLEQTRAELALILGVSEGAASRLVNHATSLVRELPATLAVMTSGALGWEYAVIIVEECQLLRAAGVEQSIIDAFEQALLGKADGSKLPSFREKARRLRERQYPETIPPRTKRAYKDRRLGLTRSSDGMSWLSLYAPSPALEAVWDRCTLTAQAAQGPHESRTLTQLRADIAAALLLGQTMAENHINSPAPANSNAGDSNASSSNTGTAVPTGWGDRMETAGGLGSAGVQCPPPADATDATDATDEWFPPPASEPLLPDLAPDLPPDPGAEDFTLVEGQVPVFDDPDYSAPHYTEPQVADDTADAPGHQPLPLAPSPGENSARPGVVEAERFPPLPQVMPVVLIPLMSLLGFTNEPAWMEGAGPVSMDVAKRLAEKSPSLYRLMVDPVTNKPLDTAVDQYRMTKSLRTMLRIRDEYCQFPGCLAKAATAQVDHMTAFAQGGKTTPANLEHLCKRHHHMKHFKDDKNRYGQPRSVNEPERTSLRLRGWTPHRESDGRISWTSPTGKYYPPEPGYTQPPAYPTWLKKHLTQLAQNPAGEEGNEAEECRYVDPEYDNDWDAANITEPTSVYAAEDNEISWQRTIQEFQQHPLRH